MIATHGEAKCVRFDERKNDTKVARNAKFEKHFRQPADAKSGVKVRFAEIFLKLRQPPRDFFKFGVAPTFGPMTPACTLFNREGPLPFRPTV